VETKQLETIWLEQNLEYRVYIPPCYNIHREQGYPVLYLIHGYGYNDDQWDRLGVDEISDELIRNGETPPFIIVMPHDRGHNVQPPENQFGEAFINDLVTAVDNEFHTISARHYRAIGGLSRGGNWAIHIGLTHWATFGAIGGHSAPLFVSDGPPQLREWLDIIPPDRYPRIFMDVGEKDKWLNHIIRFEEMLDEYNIPHELYIFPGGHSEGYWSSHTEQYLRWYARGW
jgi:enterochelin esterase-like enzyme